MVFVDHYEKQVFLSFGDDVNLVFQASILGFV